jgi:hypothetical protein
MAAAFLVWQELSQTDTNCQGLDAFWHRLKPFKRAGAGTKVSRMIENEGVIRVSGYPK